MAQWSDTQSLFQLAVTVNFGVTLIVQLRESGIATEWSVVETFSSQIDELAPKRSERWEQDVTGAIGEFHRLYNDKNLAIKWLSGRRYAYLLYAFSIISLVLLVVATLADGNAPLGASIAGTVFCAVPVVSGAAFMLAERSLLKRLRTARTKVIKSFSSVT